MTVKCKITIAALVTSAAIAVTLLLAPAHRALAQAKTTGVLVSGIIYGQFGFDDNGELHWLGHASVSFDKKPPVFAKIVDKNIGGDGNNYSHEQITFTFIDGSGSFDVLGRFTANAGSTPGLYYLHEEGSIANGTGKYANASGKVTLQGPYVWPDEWWLITDLEGEWPGAGWPMWMPEVHGIMFGIQ